MTLLPGERSGNLLGILAMILGVALFAGVDAILKMLVEHYPPLQVAGLRGLVALPILSVWIHQRGSWGTLLAVRARLQLLRGSLAVGMLVLLTLGYRDLPLANAYTLYFIAPLLMTVLAGPVLGERVAKVHWWAVAGGLVGVLVALRPGADGFINWVGLTIVGAAMCYAGVAVLTRLVSRTDSKESLMFWMAVLMAAVPSLLAWPDWVSLKGEHMVWLAVLAVIGFLAQLAITEAFRYGNASVVAPFEYTALAWAIGLDWLVWSKLPEMHTLVGGVVILLSGFYVLRYEMRSHRSAPVKRTNRLS